MFLLGFEILWKKWAILTNHFDLQARIYIQLNVCTKCKNSVCFIFSKRYRPLWSLVMAWNYLETLVWVSWYYDPIRYIYYMYYNDWVLMDELMTFHVLSHHRKNLFVYKENSRHVFDYQLSFTFCTLSQKTNTNF